MPLTLSYNTNVPNGPDDPADDQPFMLTNTQSINTWTNVDHIGYNVINAGIHKQVTMRNQAAPGLGDGQGVLYANLVNGQSWPFWQNADAGSPFALMSFAPLLATNGYIILPGSVLIQWGSNSATSSGSFASGSASGTVTFASSNIPFSVACYNVLTIPFYTTAAPNGVGTVNVDTATLSNTIFNWKFNSNSGSYTGFYWLAIGK